MFFWWFSSPTRLLKIVSHRKICFFHTVCAQGGSNRSLLPSFSYYQFSSSLKGEHDKSLLALSIFSSKGIDISESIILGQDLSLGLSYKHKNMFLELSSCKTVNHLLTS